MDNKFTDLDEDKIQEPLNESQTNNGQRKKARRQTAMHRNRWCDWYYLRRFAFIPVIILALIVIIVAYNKRVKKSAIKEEASAEQTVAVESMSSAESVAETEDSTIVREYYDEYLTAFFEQYFEARLNADTDTLYTLTGVSNQTDEQTAALQAQLKTQAGYIESYQDIRQYAVNALEENSKLVFVTYNVKFRRVETLAPGIMYCYVKVNDANQFEIVENLNSDETKFVNEYITNHSEVQSIINSSNSKLLQAISNDERLAVIYDAFQSGRIYTDSQENIDSEVSLIEVEGNEITSAAGSDEESVDIATDESESNISISSDVDDTSVTEGLPSSTDGSASDTNTSNVDTSSVNIVNADTDSADTDVNANIG